MVDLFAQPTLAALAAKASSMHAPSVESASGPLLVRAGSDKPIVFMAHDGAGSLLYARSLASQLDPGVTVYGLPEQTRDESAAVRVEDLAERLRSLLSVRQPRGPYWLAGWSFGGLLVYEIAAQLISLGEDVQSLNLIDAPSPGALRRSPRGALLCDDLRALLLEYVTDGSASRPRENTTVLELSQNYEHFNFESIVELCRTESLLPPRFLGESTQQIYERLRTEQQYYAAGGSYKPSRLSIPVNLYAAEETSKTMGDSLGWNRVLKSEHLRVTTIPGDHYSMLKSPNISVLVDALSGALISLSKSASE
jgi:thioesterase domain-containing protein